MIGGLIVVLAIGACSTPGSGSTPGAGQATGGTQASGGAPGASSATGPGSSGSGSGSRSNPGYKAGTASATVQVAGTPYSFSGGTCKQDASVLYLFELVAGQVKSPPYLDIYVADMASPLHDGDYSGDLVIVTIGVQGAPEVVQAKVTLANGITAGSFTGTSAGTSPKQVSGTFTC